MGNKKGEMAMTSSTNNNEESAESEIIISSSGNNNNNNNKKGFMKSILFFNNNIINSNNKVVKKGGDDVVDPKPLPFLSPLANSVLSTCSKILLVSTEDLQHEFDKEISDTLKRPLTYARNFLEFISYKTLNAVSAQPKFLSDKEFRRLSFDMMLAWEAPDVDNKPSDLQETAVCSNEEVEDEDGWSLFYTSSTKMAVQVDNKKTVGPEAFSRIAPACAAIADIITVHNLFDALTSSSHYRLHFLVYDKYLRTLNKVVKSVKSAMVPQVTSNLHLAEGEIVLDVDGTVPMQPLLQHIGISAWPGRLTLTNYALYFESLGVGLYEKAVRYDLALDMKQVIRPELTGPLGARLFDKAVMYKSAAIAEPIYFEFPEFKGNSRRDYWLDVSLEIKYAHRFIRKHCLKGIQQSEALSRASLGIFRYRAVREAFSIFSSHYKTLLCFNLAESLPGGDTILETLSDRLVLLDEKEVKKFPVSVAAIHRLGILSDIGVDIEKEVDAAIDVCVGEMNPLEMAVKQSKQNTIRAEAAKATVEQVKVEGIDTNLAVMKELLFPAIKLLNELHVLASWRYPWKSSVFVVLISYVAYRGWMTYILASFFVIVAVIMLWRKHAKKEKPLEAFKITIPPSKNPIEQLLTLQDAITQAEYVIQAGNVVLLKFRALLFSALPQATDGVVLLLVVVAILLTIVPLKLLFWSIFFEAFTREMPLRKASSDRWLRRTKEWWVRIPAAPVHLLKADDKKRK